MYKYETKKQTDTLYQSGFSYMCKVSIVNTMHPHIDESAPSSHYLLVYTLSDT